MPRIRTFKAELFDDEKLTQCSLAARFLFLGLLPYADDLGRLQYTPGTLKGRIFPQDDLLPSDVDAMVQELDAVGVIELYSFQARPGSKLPAQRWLRIPNFLRHQVIDRPSHCTSPPSPTETDRLARLCRCAKPFCVKAREDAEKNGHGRKRFLKELDEDSTSQRVIDEGSVSTHRVLDEHSRRKEGREGSIRGQSREDLYIQPNEEQTPEPEPSRAEERRARSAVLAGIAKSILSLLKVEPNSSIISTLVKTIEVRARSKKTSEEAAAQEIASRGAWVLAEGAPEDWALWIADARYEYVPEGDSRLKDVSIEARPVCGGKRCSEGWETVTVGEVKVSRRCPDCARIWAEAGG